MSIRLFWGQLLGYTGYIVTICLVQLLVISIVTFFHFLLGHDLSTVDDWIWDYGWELILFTKISSLIFFSGILVIDQRKERNLGRYLKAWNIKFTQEIWSLILAFLFIIFYWHYPFQWGYPLNIYRTIISLLGHSLFLGVDILVIVLLNQLWPYKGKLKIPLMIIFAGLFYLCNTISFPFAKNMGMVSLFYYLICSTIALAVTPNISWVFLFIFLVMLPHVVFLGPDLVWGDNFNILVSGEDIRPIGMVVLLLLTLIYLSIQRKKIMKKLI